MTQVQRIIQYMNDFGSISTMEAFTELGITRLASRIHEIRKMGIGIETETVKSRNRYDEPVHFNRYRIA